MGFLSGFKQRREQKSREAALRISNPYVLIPDGHKTMWIRWELLVGAETAGIFSGQNGLPVSMTKDECLAANGGNLPDYWGEVQYAWRSEGQKQAFYDKYPDRFRRQAIVEPPSKPNADLSDEYPTKDRVQDVFSAWKANGKDGIVEILEQQVQEREAAEADSEQRSASIAPTEKHELTHEHLMRLVEESSTRDLTDEEVSLLASRLCWRDEAARLQWYGEQGIDPPGEGETI